MTTQHAVTIKNHQLIDSDIAIAQPTGHDVLVKVQAAGLNPVDLKRLEDIDDDKDNAKILGYDAVGKVVATGNAATKFKEGDIIYYAGSIIRDGSYQEFQLVDERIAALKPANLSLEEAAAIPLVSLTAFELLFERMHLVAEPNGNAGQSLLVINGAGGVGSMLIPLAKWAGLEVTATASPRKFDYLRQIGVDHPIDYRSDSAEGLRQLPANSINNIVALYNIAPYWDEVARLVAPLGHVGTIVELDSNLAISDIKNKAVSFDWEFMFTKSSYGVDLSSQGNILELIGDLMGENQLQPQKIEVFNGLSAQTLTTAFEKLRRGHTTGKLVIKY